MALADIETIFSGCASTVRSPLSPVTVTGKAPPEELLDAASSPDDEPPQALRARSRESSSAISGSRGDRVGRDTGVPL